MVFEYLGELKLVGFGVELFVGLEVVGVILLELIHRQIEYLCRLFALFPLLYVLLFLSCFHFLPLRQSFIDHLSDLCEGFFLDKGFFENDRPFEVI